MKIATAPAMRAKKWRNAEFSIDELKGRLTNTIRTEETLAAFLKMSKKEQAAIKDKGAFVGGHLADGRRQRGNVLCRSMLCLDADHCKPSDIENIVSKLAVLCIWHTTHKHRPEAPRLRLIIPLAREVSAEEYRAVTHMVAWGTGILEMLDDSTFEPERAMFWPTTSCDGEFLSGVADGPWLDPDDYLALYDDWHDSSTWPVSSRVSAVVKHGAEEAEDPLAKEGIIGAFCRAYGIAEAISKFLPEVYEETDKDSRWAYAEGEGTAGLVVYDDRFAYSHHSTDPACGMLLNAFDLVRLHKFRDLDAGCSEGTPVSKLPSFGAMEDLASKDPKVRKLVVEELTALAAEEFKDDPEEEELDWRSKLTLRRKSTIIEDTIANLELILGNDESLTGLAFNELAGRVEVLKPVPWRRPPGDRFWRDSDTHFLTAFLDKLYGVFSKRNFEAAFSNTVQRRSFHPVRDFLDSLPEWDGTNRVEEVLIKYLGAADSPYVRAVTRKTFAAAVARVYQPGTKFDCMLVLNGAQGIGKSTIFRDLASEEFYSESLSLTDMENPKDAAEKLQGVWFVEVSELAGMKKATVEAIKSFISRTRDDYRPAYGRSVESHPRSCVIVGTVNGADGYLRDTTGNRRFWDVRLARTDKTKTWNFDEEFRRQFWAEAKALWKAGEKLYLEGEVAEAAEKAQLEAMEVDERVGIVQEYLDTPLPEDWDRRDELDRKDYYLPGGEAGEGKGTVRRKTVSNMEIWCECFGRRSTERTGPEWAAIPKIMQQVPGWKRSEKAKRIKGYGKQRLYVREEE